MNIERKLKEPLTFSDLKPGEVFEICINNYWLCNLYMKLGESYMFSNFDINAVDLDTNKLVSIKSEDPVKVINVKLVEE